MSHHATDKVFWYTTAPTLQTKLQHDIKTEVVVVGGGMAGLVAAHTLVKSGKKVTLLEASFVGAGASGKSSGFITPDSELELGSMISNHGPEKARKLWEFVCSGVENIRSLIQAYNIECGYQVQDSVFISNGPHKDKKVFEEHEARESLSYESRLYTRPQHIIGSDSYSSAVRYGGTFGINAYQFCQAMKSVLMSLGVEVFEQTPVTEIKTDGVLANGHNVTAEQIVLCTDRLLPELGILKKDVYNVQTFLGITKPLKPEIMKRLFPDGPLMVWDTDLIYQYFRPTTDNRLMIGAASLLYSYMPSEIHGSRLTEYKLESYLQKKFPWLHAELEYLWPGLIGASKDFVPLANQDAKQKNLYYMSAATGLPWAAAVGNYIAEKAVSGRSDFDADFTPNRKYPIGSMVQMALRKPLTFMLSHGLVKYFG